MIELAKNSDFQFSFNIDDYKEVNGVRKFVGTDDLTEYSKIIVKLGYAQSLTPEIKYTTETPTPTGYRSLTISGTIASFTVYKEDTAEMNIGDIYMTIELTTAGAREDGEDYKEIKPREKLFKLVDEYGN